MIINRVFASYTFRFMSAYVACLSVAVFIVLAIIYATFSYDYFTDVHNTVTQELDEFNLAYQHGGVDGADEFVASRLNRGDFNRFFYLIVDADNQKVAGNLNHWPDINQYSDGWLGFELNVLSWDGESMNADFVARSIELSDGHKLLTARHYDDVISSAKLVSGALIRSMIATIVLGTIGGAIVAGLSVRRIDNINKSYPNRFVVFANVDFEGAKDMEWGEKAAAQLEEDITKVEWLTDAEIETKVLKNTYASIKELL